MLRGLQVSGLRDNRRGKEARSGSGSGLGMHLATFQRIVTSPWQHRRLNYSVFLPSLYISVIIYYHYYICVYIIIIIIVINYAIIIIVMMMMMMMMIIAIIIIVYCGQVSP